MKSKLLYFFLLLNVFQLKSMAANINVTFQVDMSRELNVTTVTLAGDFQNPMWNPSATPMTKTTGNIYSVVVSLPASSTVNYRFIANGAWEQPTGACATALTRKMVLPSSSVILPVECFNNCGACSNTPPVNVTLKVDMSNKIISPNGVHITGSFQGWDPSTTKLSRVGTSNYYAVTIPVYQGSLPFQYKFLNGNGWGTEETISGNCQSGSNRTLIIPKQDSTIVVCFGECSSTCSALVNVTFSVDMSHVTASANGVHIAGDFQGWDPAASLLTNSGAGIYKITVPIIPGTTLNYKFLNGNSWGTDEKVIGSCVYQTNRYFTIGKKDTSVALVCFGYCDAACTPPAGLRVACIGNSITFGAGVSDPKTQSYPAQLQSMLGNGYLVSNFGHSGATMLKNGDLPYWGVAEFGNAKAFNPDVVIIKLGTNDSKSWNWGAYGGQYVGDYESMIDIFRALPSKPKVFVCYAAKAFGAAYGIDENVLATKVRPDVKKISKDKGVSLIDLFDATKNLSANFPDGVHPDAVGSGAIAAKVNALITAAPPAITINKDTLIAAAGYGYQWYFNNDTIPTSAGGINRKYVQTKAGEYKVLVKMNAGNDDRLISNTINVTLMSSVQSVSGHDLNVAFYPNPSENNTVLSIDTESVGNVTVTIENTIGQGVRTIELLKDNFHFEHSIDLQNLQNGIYIVKVQIGEFISFKRLLKQ